MRATATPLSKSQAKLGMTAKREQIRRFGEYAGEDGLETLAPDGNIWNGSPCKYSALCLAR